MNLGQPALDYFPCRYGASRLLFRGPRRRLQGDYIAFLGGAETYGKFIETPFPALIEHEIGVRSVNLGCVNAGVDVYGSDRTLIDICGKARVTVIQIVGAQNMSNRFYAVHPRRNDRFLRASSSLQKIYDDVDFTDFNFVRHMLQALAERSPDRFALVREELKEAWVGRMHGLIRQIDGEVVLLWLADHPPPTGDEGLKDNDPLFVDRAMIHSLSGVVSHIAEVVANPAEIADGLDEMVFSDLERPAAAAMTGPVVHRRAASCLAPVLAGLV
jgi:hypothetical protein